MEKIKQKMKKSLGYANKLKIPYVVIIGKNEIETNKIRLKNMNDCTNTEFDLYDYEGIKKAIIP